jgi:hypothetical protein
MTGKPPWKTTTGLTAMAFIVLATFFIATVTTNSDTPKPLLEVINRHFTMGKRIPSVYLRVFSDGTVECHMQKYTGKEIDSVKRKTLAAQEFETLRAVIENPALSRIKSKYGLMSFVIDSWMEWDIRVAAGSRTRTFEILNFSPKAARERSQSYPASLVRLGCSIEQLRAEVFEENGFPSFDDDCKTALAKK